MSNASFDALRLHAKSVTDGIVHLESLLYSIRLAAQGAIEDPDPEERIRHIDSLARLGIKEASVRLGGMVSINHIISELDQPRVDMMESALQADCIVKSLSALCQVIPEDQADTLGAIKTVLKLAHDLSTHLVTGGRYKYVLKEAIEANESEGVCND